MWKTKRIFLGSSAQIPSDSPLWREGRGGSEHRGRREVDTWKHTPSEVQSHNSVVQGPEEWPPSPWVWSAHHSSSLPTYTVLLHCFQVLKNKDKNNDTQRSLLNSIPLIFDKMLVNWQRTKKRKLIQTTLTQERTPRTTVQKCPQKGALYIEKRLASFFCKWQSS